MLFTAMGCHAMLVDLHLEHHPAVLAALSNRVSKDKNRVSNTLATKIIYHADPDSQFSMHTWSSFLVRADEAA